MTVEAVKVDKQDRSLKRKKSRKNLESDAPVETVDAEARERKRQKKEEKERRRKATMEEVEAVKEADIEPAPEPAPVSEKKSSKKDRKSKKSAHTESSTEITTVYDTIDSKQEKKKKKRKHDNDPNAQVPSASALPDDSPSSSKKDNKKKKPKPDASTPAPSNAVEPVDAEAYFAQHSISISVPSGSTPVAPVLSFDQLLIPDDLRSAFAGFTEPTPVQACTWPPMLEGRDVVGIAETGSGKTLAFGIPALARLINTPSKKSKSVAPRVLVLAPTRELALQTHDSLKAIGAAHKLRCVAVFGGISKDAQIKELKNGAHIVVGTPGRIKDLVGDEALDLSKVEYLVLDEADRMLDKGFENDIRMIVGWTKAEGRQTLMFSATWPDAVRRLAASFQRDPVRVTVGSDDLTANSRVEQVLEVFDSDYEKDSRLLNHLQILIPKKNLATAQRILIFALYKKEAARLEETLRRKGYTVTGLHGDMAQQKRLDALQSFRDGTTRLLVATDVAARGLDIPDVGVVINYTFPLTTEDYIHRIGRTGRGGKTGKSITFFTGEKHERALAGELAGVLREGGFDGEAQKLAKFPMSVKKKTHSAYGAFFRDDVDLSAAPTKITFD